jgi:drug/metabolite transporter (DMT)-like permease
MSTDRILPAIGMRLLSVVIFALMNSAIKLAERHGASVSEILFFRQFGACLLVSGVILAGPGLPSIATKRLPAHIVRAIVGLSAMAFTFNGIVALPLAEATTIGFTVPIFATILGALWLREPTGWHRWGAVIAGFVGVLIVARPGGEHFPLWGAGCALAGAFGTASVSILLRQIGKTESALTTVFWFSALSLIPLSLVYALAVQPHGLVAWVCLASVGILGGLAQIAMTTSLRLGRWWCRWIIRACCGRRCSAGWCSTRCRRKRRGSAHRSSSRAGCTSCGANMSAGRTKPIRRSPDGLRGAPSPSRARPGIQSHAGKGDGEEEKREKQGMAHAGHDGLEPPLTSS